MALAAGQISSHLCAGRLGHIVGTCLCSHQTDAYWHCGSQCQWYNYSHWSRHCRHAPSRPHCHRRQHGAGPRMWCRAGAVGHSALSHYWRNVTDRQVTSVRHKQQSAASQGEQRAVWWPVGGAGGWFLSTAARRIDASLYGASYLCAPCTAWNGWIGTISHVRHSCHLDWQHVFERKYVSYTMLMTWVDSLEYNTIHRDIWQTARQHASKQRWSYTITGNLASQNKLESTQRVQTSAKDFHVLLLAIYRNHNSKQIML